MLVMPALRVVAALVTALFVTGRRPAKRVIGPRAPEGGSAIASDSVIPQPEES
jgi:hypothetical protein